MDLETIVPDAPEQAVDLFKCFVKYDSQKRLSAELALKHTYFSTKPFAAELQDMPKPREKRSVGTGGTAKNTPEIQAEVSFNEMFADLFELASK